jgi:hypothetical protein
MPVIGEQIVILQAKQAESEASGALISTHDVWLCAGIGLGCIVFAMVASAIDAMSGKGKKSNERKRADFASVEDWLLSAAQKARCTFDLEGFVVSCPSTATQEVWDVQRMPALNADGASHFFGWLGPELTHRLLPDMRICPTSIEIEAPAAKVWAAVLDFENYGT